jgi:hypothetical protein
MEACTTQSIQKKKASKSGLQVKLSAILKRKQIKRNNQEGKIAIK